MDARQPGSVEVRRIGANLPPAISLPDLRFAQTLACLVTDYQRRVNEHQRIVKASRAVCPVDRLLDAAGPATIENLALCIEERHPGFICRQISAARSPSKIDTQKPCNSHLRVVPHCPLTPCHADINILICLRPADRAVAAT